MSCSAVTLSISTVLSVIAVACLAIGFSTDNWYEIRVNYNKTKNYFDMMEGIVNDYDSNYLYYSRDEGLFRVCFADKKPKERKYLHVISAKPKPIFVDSLIFFRTLSDWVTYNLNNPSLTLTELCH